MSGQLIAESAAEVIIRAPLASVDLTEWVFILTDSEYQACSKDHYAGATTLTPEGKRMSLNVERVGNLMVQQYVEDVAEPSHVRLVSQSDSIGPDIGSRVKIVVIWAFTAAAIDAATTKFTNSVEVRSTLADIEALEGRGVPLAKASEAAQQALSAHNAEETPCLPRTSSGRPSPSSGDETGNCSHSFPSEPQAAMSPRTDFLPPSMSVAARRSEWMV
jgi:hypothetical protein